MGRCLARTWSCSASRASLSFNPHGDGAVSGPLPGLRLHAPRVIRVSIPTAMGRCLAPSGRLGQQRPDDSVSIPTAMGRCLARPEPCRDSTGSRSSFNPHGDGAVSGPQHDDRQGELRDVRVSIPTAMGRCLALLGPCSFHAAQISRFQSPRRWGGVWPLEPEDLRASPRTIVSIPTAMGRCLARGDGPETEDTTMTFQSPRRWGGVWPGRVPHRPGGPPPGVSIPTAMGRCLAHTNLFMYGHQMFFCFNPHGDGAVSGPNLTGANLTGANLVSIPTAMGRCLARRPS